MFLVDMKKKVLSLIEEIDTDETSLTNDPDIEAKLPYVINQVIYELSRFKKIPAYEEESVTENQQLDLTTLDGFYQLARIKGVEYEVLTDTLVKINETGTAKISYYKYPTRIDETTLDTYEFELSDDVLEIGVYGIAGDLLKSDVSTSYGVIYSNRYKELLQTLDPRYQLGVVEIADGLDI